MIEVEVNGKSERLDVDPQMPLLWALRDVIGLTGTKYGCGVGLCGACTVYVDGQPTPACLTPVGSVADAAVTTIEGLDSPAGRAVQAAWRELDVPQCGYCQSGQIMAAAALIDGNRSPSDADIDAALDGNLCRCATYGRIRAAVKLAAKSLPR
jgi:isoquinoline 1-oxidoreductase alpha subunit